MLRAARNIGLPAKSGNDDSSIEKLTKETSGLLALEDAVELMG